MARPAKYDDDEILDRAMHMFWHQGWSATSIRDLERQLDLKAPSIYRRFGDKDGLARAVLEHYLGRVIERRIERHLTGEGDPIQNIRSFVLSALRPGREGEPPIGCLLTVTAAELPVITPGLGRPLARGLRRIEGAIRAEVARAASEGRIDAGLDPAEVTDRLALSFQGLMVLARSGVAPGELAARADSALADLRRAPVATFDDAPVS